MTLRELLVSTENAYFYYDPKGLNRERREIRGSTPACLQKEGKPDGWRTGGTVHGRRDQILVDLSGKVGAYLDKIRVV